MKKTKIICSIGPSTQTWENFKGIVEAGMNVARINFSHATIEERENVVSVVNEVRKLTNQAIGILYDTKGPEFRSGMLEDGEITLVDGNIIRVVKQDILGNVNQITVNHPNKQF